MDVLQKLQNEVKRLDRQVKQSLWNDGYDFRSAQTRDLLEAAIKEIAHLQLHRDLLRSELLAEKGAFYTNSVLTRVDAGVGVYCVI